MSRILSLSLAAVAVATLSSAASAATFFSNGDFEAGTVGANPPSFTVFPGNEIVTLNGQAYVTNAGGTGSGAALTNKFASFGPGQAPNVSSLAQVIDTVAGQLYSLSFDFGTFGSGSQTLNLGFFDSVNNVEISQFTFTDVGSFDLNTLFASNVAGFTAGSNRTRVSFSISGQPSNNVDALLDNVSVQAVPEPGTWAMMLVGFGAVGGAMRNTRRRKLTSLAAA